MFALRAGGAACRVRISHCKFLLRLCCKGGASAYVSCLLACCSEKFSKGPCSTKRSHACSVSALPRRFPYCKGKSFEDATFTMRGTSKDVDYSLHCGDRGVFSKGCGLRKLPTICTDRRRSRALRVLVRSPIAKIGIILLCKILPTRSVVAEDIYIGGRDDNGVCLGGVRSTDLSFLCKSCRVLAFCNERTVRQGIREIPIIRKARGVKDIEKASDRRCGPVVVLTRGRAARSGKGYCTVSFMCDKYFRKRILGSRLGRAEVVLKLRRRTFHCPLRAKRVFRTPRIVLSCSSRKVGHLSRGLRRYVERRVYENGCGRRVHPVLVGD